jgi:hypothetical protein
MEVVAMTRLKHWAATRRLLEIVLAILDLAIPFSFFLLPNSWLATATAVLSALVKFVGMPKQILEITAKRSAETNSLLNATLNYASYALWVVYGLRFHNPIIWTAQLPGWFLGISINIAIRHYKSFRWMPRYAANGHAIGAHCNVCDQVLQAARARGAEINSKWPNKCDCGDKNRHALNTRRLFPNGRRDDGPPNVIESWCEGCHKRPLCKVGDVELEKRKHYYIKAGREAHYEDVGLEKYMEYYDNWVRSNQLTARALNWQVVGRPACDAFNDQLEDVSGIVSDVPLDALGHDPTQPPVVVPTTAQFPGDDTA